MSVLIDVLLGMLGGLIVVASYALGMRNTRSAKVDVDKSEETERQRKELAEYEDAFRQQMSYNASIAYGMTASPFGGDES